MTWITLNIDKKFALPLNNSCLLHCLSFLLKYKSTNLNNSTARFISFPCFLGLIPSSPSKHHHSIFTYIPFPPLSHLFSPIPFSPLFFPPHVHRKPVLSSFHPLLPSQISTVSTTLIIPLTHSSIFPRIIPHRTKPHPTANHHWFSFPHLETFTLVWISIQTSTSACFLLSFSHQVFHLSRPLCSRLLIYQHNIFQAFSIVFTFIISLFTIGFLF